MVRNSKNFAKLMLEAAGISINGPQPWDIQVKNENLFNRVMREGSLGLGEAYQDGWWEAGRLDQFFYQLLKADLDRVAKKNWQYLIWAWGPTNRNRLFQACQTPL